MAKSLSVRNRLRRAFEAVEVEGGVAVVGECCQTCSWARVPDNHDESKPVVIMHVQSEEGGFGNRRNVNLKNKLYLNHGGNSARLVEILKAFDLNVEWNGDEHQSIVIHPEAV